MFTRIVLCLSAFALVAGLAGCATTPPFPQTAWQPAPSPITVLSVTPFTARAWVVEPRQSCGTVWVQQRQGSTAGTLLGALIGGALGHQVGQGRGNTAATIGGAVLGGFVGNASSGPSTAVPEQRCITVDVRRAVWVTRYRVRYQTPSGRIATLISDTPTP